MTQQLENIVFHTEAIIHLLDDVCTTLPKSERNIVRAAVAELHELRRDLTSISKINMYVARSGDDPDLVLVSLSELRKIVNATKHIMDNTHRAN